jgi:hypothetical protein
MPQGGASGNGPVTPAASDIGQNLASIRADDVFWRIEWIAHSIESLEGRRGRAETRIDEFLADLAKANLPPGLADTIAGRLKAKLERVVSIRAAAGSADTIFRAALGRLTAGHH